MIFGPLIVGKVGMYDSTHHKWRDGNICNLLTRFPAVQYLPNASPLEYLLSRIGWEGGGQLTRMIHIVYCIHANRPDFSGQSLLWCCPGSKGRRIKILGGGSSDVLHKFDETARPRVLKYGIPYCMAPITSR